MRGAALFFWGVCTCRAGPVCPAAGYAFFGGARGPRPTGGYVEPRVGDAVPAVPPVSFRASAHTGVGIRFSSPPSEREVSARSADGGREATRFSLPQSAAPTAPSQRGPNSAALPRCHCEEFCTGGTRDVEDAVPYTFNSSGHKSPSKSQQFPAKFCAPIQNMKILPETVANVLRRCYI